MRRRIELESLKADLSMLILARRLSLVLLLAILQIGDLNILELEK